MSYMYAHKYIQKTTTAQTQTHTTTHDTHTQTRGAQGPPPPHATCHMEHACMMGGYIAAPGVRRQRSDDAGAQGKRT